MSTERSMLQDALRSVLRRWRAMLVIRGVSVIAIAAVTLFLCGVSAVHFFDPGIPVRILFLTAAAGILGWLAFRFLLTPLHHSPSDLQVARYIEERHPALNDALVSAVEYGDSQLRGPQRDLMDQVLEYVAGYTEQIEYKKIVDRGRHARLQAGAAGTVLVLAGLIFLEPGYFGRSALRLVPWTQMEPALPGGIRVEPGDTRVRRGDNLTVTAILGSGLGPEPNLFVRFGQDVEWSKLDLYVTDSERTFSGDIHRIGENAQYYVAVAETRSGEFRISAIDPPFVERIDARYVFPDYMELVSKTEEDRGDITAPVGTRVALRITASKAVVSGAMRFSDGRSVELEVSGKDLEGAFVVREDLSYTIHVVDPDGFANDDPVEYYVRALQDRAPRVAILEPQRDTRVSPVDEVMIRAEAEDDFGLATFFLNYAVNGGEEAAVDLGVLQSESSGTVWEGEHVVYLENLGVQPGDFVAYYAKAGDRRSDAGTSATDIYFIEIKPFDATYRKGEDGGEGAGEGAGDDVIQTRQLSRKQKEIISATWRVKRTLAAEPGFQAEEDLDAIATVQDGLRDQVEEALALMRFMVGFSQEAMKMVETLELALAPMASASEALRTGEVDEALVHEREALMYLTKLDAQMREFTVSQQRGMSGRAPLDLSDTSELELDDERNRYEVPDQPALEREREQDMDEHQLRVQDLARRQERANERMRKLAAEEDRPEAERRRELDRLTRTQRDLRAETEEIARSLSGTRNPSEGRGAQSGAQRPMLNQADRDLRESSESMGESIEQLRRGRLQTAAEGGAQAARHLADASSQLQRAQGTSLERLAREAVKQADQLAARQEQLERNVNALKEEKAVGFEGILNRLDAIDSRRGGEDESPKERRLDWFLRDRMRGLEGAKEETRSDLERLEEDLEFLARSSSRVQPKTASAAERAVEMIVEEQLSEQIERSKRLLNRDSLDRSARTETEISAALDRLAEMVRTARDKLITRDMDHLSRTQDSAREAMSDWQELQRRLYRLNRGIPDAETLDQISQDYRRQLQRLRDLSGRVPQMSRESRQLQDDLDRALALGDEPWKIDRGAWNELHLNMARSLVDYYDRLRAEVRDMRRKERLYLAREEDVPPGYRDLVNDYFENLSRNGNRN